MLAASHSHLTAGMHYSLLALNTHNHIKSNGPALRHEFRTSLMKFASPA